MLDRGRAADGWSPSQGEARKGALEPEFTAAVGASEGLWLREHGQWLIEGGTEEGSQQGAGLLGRAALEAVVTHPGKGLGQDVKAPAADELVRVKVKDGAFASGAGGPGEPDVAFGVVAQQALGLERTLVDVAGEVTQGALTVACGLELHVPSGGGGKRSALGGIEGLMDGWVALLKGEAEAVAEALGEGAEVKEEAVAVWAHEVSRLGIEGDGGDDAVDVGMVLHLATPSMEHAGEAQLRAFELGLGEVLEGGGALPQQQVVEFAGVGFAQRAQWFGNGEGDEEVGHG